MLLDGCVSIPRRWGKTSASSKTCTPALGPTQTPIQGAPVFLHGIKRPARYANHAFPCGIEVKTEWRYTSTPPYAICLRVPYDSPNNRQLFPSAVRNVLFLGELVRFRKATISFVMSVRPSVHVEQLGSHWTDFHEILYLSNFRTSFIYLSSAVGLAPGGSTHLHIKST
jgi:hypothetical protein